MKKLLHFAWIFILSPLIIYAQSKPAPYKIGSSTSFLQRIAAGASANKDGKVGTSITLPLSATRSVAIDIHSSESGANGKNYAGKVRNQKSKFIFTQTSKLTEGSLIFEGEEKAFKLYADAQDNLYSQEVSIDEVVCIGLEKQLYSNPNEITVNIPDGQNIKDLQSFPQAKAVVLLDFDGQYVPDGAWGEAINAEPATLTREEIFEAWQVVSEDFRPFNLNITTNEAVFFNAPATQRLRVIFTPTDKAYPGSGGVAYIGSFVYGDGYPCWVFNGGGKNAGETASHEIGHTLELFHDGISDSANYEEYYYGNGTWGPIMGATFWELIGQWSKGEYRNPSNTQDDLATIASERNGFGYRNDDAGDSFGAASPLVVSSLGVIDPKLNNGNIEKNTDVDVYSFTTSGGRCNIGVYLARHSNLHPYVEFRDALGNVVGGFSNSRLQELNITLDLGPGKYYVYISGIGTGDPLVNGYTDYGSLGFYSISGNIPISTLRQPENPTNVVNGIDYKYYEGEWSFLPDFASLASAKSGIDTNFVLGTRNRDDNFGYSFNGFIEIATDGQYTFYTNSDDGSKLFIGSTLVVNNDGLHPEEERSGIIGLKAGKHAIRVEFFERGGGEVLGVKYSAPGISKRNVSKSQLFRINIPIHRTPENPNNIVNGLDSKYYEGEWSMLPNFGALTSVSQGSSDNFLLDSRSRNDNFGFSFNGFVEVPTDGSYTFYTTSDDGSKLYIGSSLVVDNDGLHAEAEKSGNILLRAGKHAIRVDFFERTGGEILNVKYEGPGISKQLIPSSKLYRINTPTLRYPENPQSLSAGLAFKYFEGTGWGSVQDLVPLTAVKTGVSTNFSLSQRNRNDDFGFEFNGYIQVPSDGLYTFYTNSDDGSRLFVGSALVVENDGLHADQQRAGSIGLRQGKHAIKVVFFERTGYEVLDVRYEGPNLVKQFIPDNQLFRVSSGAAVSSEETINLYPNPSQNIVNIESLGGVSINEVLIFDIFGNNVRRINSGTDKLTIDISDLKSGLYTVHVKTLDNVSIKRLEIE